MESDEVFLNEMEQWVIGSLVFKKEHRERLFALARRGAANGDMVEAARLTAMIDLDACTEHDQALLEEAVRVSRAAIAKATGEKNDR